jgi:hypothetical protein
MRRHHFLQRQDTSKVNTDLHSQLTIYSLVYLCVLYDCWNIQQLFPSTALISWSL